MMKTHKQFGYILMSIILLLSTLSGCAGEEQGTATTDTQPIPTVTVNTTEEVTATLTEEITPATDEESIVYVAETENMPDSTAATEEMTEEENGMALSDAQRNSISMLNYLTVLTQEINASKNSRLYLEEVYASLLNNTYPNAVDDRTLVELTDLLDILEEYRMMNVKRERLQYIYEQNRAQALKKAVPDPLALLSAVKSVNLAQIAASVAYMAVDSYSSYTAYTAEEDLAYIKEGWMLDDEEAETLHNSRKATFDYMIQMVGDYALPGDLALNESSVEEFVSWKNNSNVLQKIQFFERNEETYQAFGDYWLTLAECYYENGDYEKCLEAVSMYEGMDVRIFRKDYGLAEILPLAVVAAGQVLDGKNYYDKIEHYAEEILSNSDHQSWELQYFAAQTYLELYAGSGDIQYMEKSYDIILNNVNHLINVQKDMNAEYLAEIAEVEIPEDASKEDKKEIKEYNKMLKEERKTALAPIYEPLILNCELLFSLAEKMDIPDSEKDKVDGILHEKGEALFLVESVDSMYRFDQNAGTDIEDDSNIEFDGKILILPAKYISEYADITVTVDGKDVFKDWKLDEVSRETNEEFESFTAIYTSKEAKKYDYKANMDIRIEINSEAGSGAEILTLKYRTAASKTLFVIPDIKFERK